MVQLPLYVLCASLSMTQSSISSLDWLVILELIHIDNELNNSPIIKYSKHPKQSFVYADNHNTFSECVSAFRMQTLQPLLLDSKNTKAKVGIPEYAFINMHNDNPHAKALVKSASGSQCCT